MPVVSLLLFFLFFAPGISDGSSTLACLNSLVLLLQASYTRVRVFEWMHHSVRVEAVMPGMPSSRRCSAYACGRLCCPLLIFSRSMSFKICLVSLRVCSFSLHSCSVCIHKATSESGALLSPSALASRQLLCALSCAAGVPALPVAARLRILSPPDSCASPPCTGAAQDPAAGGSTNGPGRHRTRSHIHKQQEQK